MAFLLDYSLGGFLLFERILMVAVNCAYLLKGRIIPKGFYLIFALVKSLFFVNKIIIQF